jgi:hypothetical protein
MASEEPVNNWFDRNNPLNCGLGSGGGAGLGSYTNLVAAAYYVAENLTNGSVYGTIIGDLERSASPAITGSAIWASPWSKSHYSGSPSESQYWGDEWATGNIISVAAPAFRW